MHLGHFGVVISRRGVFRDPLLVVRDDPCTANRCCSPTPRRPARPRAGSGPPALLHREARVGRWRPSCARRSLPRALRGRESWSVGSESTRSGTIDGIPLFRRERVKSARIVRLWCRSLHRGAQSLPGGVPVHVARRRDGTARFGRRKHDAGFAAIEMIKSRVPLLCPSRTPASLTPAQPTAAHRASDRPGDGRGDAPRRPPHRRHGRQYPSRAPCWNEELVQLLKRKILGEISRSRRRRREPSFENAYQTLDVLATWWQQPVADSAATARVHRPIRIERRRGPRHMPGRGCGRSQPLLPVSCVVGVHRQQRDETATSRCSVASNSAFTERGPRVRQFDLLLSVTRRRVGRYRRRSRICAERMSMPPVRPDPGGAPRYRSCGDGPHWPVARFRPAVRLA